MITPLQPSPITTPEEPAVRSAARLAGLDGLRAVAVLVVIGYHFVPSSFLGGYLGVDAFFVISGFLITGLLVKAHQDTGRLRLPRFWMRRVRRLIPALVLVVVVCAAAAFFIGGDVLVGLGRQVLGAATFSSNWLYIAQGASYFDGTSPDLFRNLWSLAVEEQFYLLWPGLMLLVLLVPWRLARIVIVLAIAAGSAVAMAALFTAPGDPTRVYYGTDTHSFGLALGAALALALHVRLESAARPSKVGAIAMPILGAFAVGALIVLAIVMPINDPFVTQGGLLVVALLTAIVIATATAPGSWLGRGLDIPPLRWIGERSYGIYLWHWPVLVLLVAAAPTGATDWRILVLALILTIAAAAISYRYVEEPIRRAGFRQAASSLWRGAFVPRTVGGIAALALIGGVGLTGAAIVADPGKSSAQLAIEQGQAALDNYRPLRPGPRRPAPLPSGDQMYAIGDSVMLAASPWLQETYPGIAIDAQVSRSMWVGPQMVQAALDAGALRPILIIGLATNGDVEASDLDAIRSIAGAETLIVVVNGQAPRNWIPVGNATVADFARRARNVELANWHDAIAPRINELAEDEVHPGGPISGGIYVGSITDALQRLAELPPLLNNNDYRWINRPI